MNPNEMWQAEVNGKIYDAAFSELAAWVDENALFPNDKVRRGNLRWLEAGKVPALMPFFNAKELGISPPEIPVSVTDGEDADADLQIHSTNFAPVENQQFQDDLQTIEFCALHNGAEAAFVCETCFNNFCEQCPQNAGNSGKTCPVCGALVKPVAHRTRVFQPENFPVQSDEFPLQFDAFPYQPQQFHLQMQQAGNFGFADFGRALIHPFKFKTSLIFGALMYMFFTLGQMAYAMGGMVMLFAALFSGMLANMLTFGILANVVENFSNRKTGTNFMPDFDDFSLWDDVIHPFFLSIAAYVVSFGLFFAVVIGGGWYVSGSLQSEMQSVRQNSTSTVMPGISKELDKLRQAQQLQQSVGDMKQQAEQSQSDAPFSIYNQEQQSRNLQNAIDDSRRSELESASATSPEARQAQMKELGLKLLTKALPFVILAGLAFLWGLFYFPAACAVAGYTRSFTATLNPRIGWDTIKNLGSDYAQILLMILMLAVTLIVVVVILHAALYAFTMPQIGNIPAIALTSWFTFYFWIVFSCILGAAIGKNSHKLGIYRG